MIHFAQIKQCTSNAEINLDPICMMDEQVGVISDIQCRMCLYHIDVTYIDVCI